MPLEYSSEECCLGKNAMQILTEKSAQTTLLDIVTSVRLGFLIKNGLFVASLGRKAGLNQCLPSKKRGGI